MARETYLELMTQRGKLVLYKLAAMLGSSKDKDGEDFIIDVNVSNAGDIGSGVSQVEGKDAAGAPSTSNPVVVATLDQGGNVIPFLSQDETTGRMFQPVGGVDSTDPGRNRILSFDENKAQVSLYGKNTAVGDTPVAVDAQGQLKTKDAGCAWSRQQQRISTNSADNPISLTVVPPVGKIVVIDDLLLTAGADMEVGFLDAEEGNSITSATLKAGVPFQLTLRSHLISNVAGIADDSTTGKVWMVGDVNSSLRGHVSYHFEDFDSDAVVST